MNVQGVFLLILSVLLVHEQNASAAVTILVRRTVDEKNAVEWVQPSSTPQSVVVENMYGDVEIYQAPAGVNSTQIQVTYQGQKSAFAAVYLVSDSGTNPPYLKVQMEYPQGPSYDAFYDRGQYFLESPENDNLFTRNFDGSLSFREPRGPLSPDKVDDRHSDPSTGIVLKEQGTAHLPPDINEAKTLENRGRDVAKIKVWIPRDQLINLQVGTKTGNIFINGGFVNPSNEGIAKARNVFLHSDIGQISVDGIQAKHFVARTRSNMQVRGVTAQDGYLSTEWGEIRIEETRGKFRTETVTGAQSIRYHDGWISVTSKSGDLIFSKTEELVLGSIQSKGRVRGVNPAIRMSCAFAASGSTMSFDY